MEPIVVDGGAVTGPVPPEGAADPDVLAGLLERRLGAVLGERAAVSGLARLTGGASRETWSFAVSAGGAPRRLVLRRDPVGEAGHGAREAAGMAREAAAIAAAAAAGVPVPRLVDAGTDAGIVGSPYLITEHVDGETIARRLLREERYAAARETMAAELGRTLARVHAVPPDAVPGLESHEPLETLRDGYDALGEPLPAVEIALRWLERHRPAPVPEALVHGDFRTGNLIIAPDGLRAVLDWEQVHRGDPREDLGWLCVKCWRFGSPLPAGGFGTVDQLLDGYAEVAGERPDPADVLWWQVYGTARWAVGCRAMAERHLSGEAPSVELAAIGRRVCEQEHDLLLALGVPPVAGGPAPAAAEPVEASDLHGSPAAADLVGAVAHFLREEVMPGTEGRLNFLARVAANVLDGVGRELVLGPAQERRHRERLAALGCDDQAALAAAVRSGEIDADDPALLAAVRAAVDDRLDVANPRYRSLPG
ncbi:phosphotransferase family protein [Spirillospora sp. NPDC029432]|uniref:phosphotransferase family protein n=1 Tax=Spirillospora sp. NPDC029432 TaxID=3154599 RepID=UPI003452786F